MRHLCLLCLTLLAGSSVFAPVAAEEEDCPAAPEGLILRAEQPIHVGGKVFLVSAREFGPLGGGDGIDFLEIDLVPEYADPATGHAVHGTYVPHLDVGYHLYGPLGEIATGTMPLTMSHLGHTYGVHVPLEGVGDPGSGPMPTLMLALTIDLVDGAPDYLGACPRLPFSIKVELDLNDLPDGREQSGEAGVDAPSDDKRFNLLANYDPDPSAASSDVWGYSDGATQLAIMGKTNGTSFIDVTDPANPAEVGFIGGPSSSWRDIKTYLTYAYITTEGSGAGEGMQIVDISDPLSPVLVNTYSDTFTTAHNLYIDTEIGEAWIVGSSNSTRILDLSADPVNPTEVGSFTERYVHDGYVDQNLACLSEINNSLQEIVDSTDPANVTVLSSWPTPISSTHNCWANDAYDLLATTDETGGGHVAVYDVTDKNNDGILLSEYNPDPASIVHNVKFDDDDNERIAISYYALGGKYVDLHRPTAPVELASYDTFPNGDSGFNGAWGVYAFDPRGYIFISDVDTGLYVLEYAPTGGTLSGVIRDAGNGNPVSEASVVVLSDGTPATSQADGVYAVYAPAGPTQLRVSAWGFSTQVIEAGTMPLDGRLDVDVDLARLARTGLSGIVRRTDNGVGIAGATVTIVGSRLSTTTAGDGSFDFADVAIGQQTLTAEAFGYSSEEVRIVLSAGNPGNRDIELAPAVFADDVETNQGWDVGLVGDTAISGEWERVDPNGTGGGTVQPEDDSTPDPGVTAFITGQSAPGASTEANDVEFGFTTLQSPLIDASTVGAAKVRYDRWLSTNAGFLGGGTLRIQISSNGGANWTNLDVSSSTANFWNRREFDVASFVPLTDQLRVRFRAEASSGFENFRVLEAGVDDFDVVEACRARFNAGAGDGDSDGTVDGCDGCPADPGNDADGDGICGDVDNAPRIANADQLDTDADGVGDVADNCPNDANVDQRDDDGDGLGNACDGDLDGDGIDNESDGDRDGDGVDNAADLCPDTADAQQLDRDGDGTGDLCDDDDGEVQGLRFDDETTLGWEPELDADSYNLYRGDLGAASLVGLAECRAVGLVPTFFVDPLQPVPGDGFFYLVTREAAGAEGTFGRATDGGERVVTEVCP